MNIAECVAMKSNDPHTHVGAVIVKDNKIISTGYNELCCYLEKSSFSSSRVGLGKTEDEK
jgi:deoxycytidylate deaminase